jgi:1,4-alpha-glucan branching enzyme
MGANVCPGGVTFRVWAPFAHGVGVVGDFNGWSAASPLAAEGGGYWSADVPGAAEGSRYAYEITGPAGVLRRKDPYAREVTHSAGDSIVRSEEFDWGDADHHSPAWDEMVIYELHAGTFNDEPGGQPGNFAGVAARLDHLVDLGVTAVELMPAVEFATDFSWGYNPADLFAIESAYGGPAALKSSVRAAHERGIYSYQDTRSWTPWGKGNRPDYGRPEVRSSTTRAGSGATARTSTISTRTPR